MSESELVNTSQLSTKLEAILYLKAQPLSIQELADYAICEEEEVEEALLILMQDYALRNSALEVVEGNNGFSLQLREEYMSLVQTIVPTDLGVGALRTLAAIALKGPIPQTQLVELRGSGAYQHVGDLAEEGFVSKRRQSNGRSYSVQVTEKFYQYFEVDELPKLKLKKTARQRRVMEDEDVKSRDSKSKLKKEQEETNLASHDVASEEAVITPPEESQEASNEDEQTIEQSANAHQENAIVTSDLPGPETEPEQTKASSENSVQEDRSHPKSPEQSKTAETLQNTNQSAASPSITDTSQSATNSPKPLEETQDIEP